MPILTDHHFKETIQRLKALLDDRLNRNNRIRPYTDEETYERATTNTLTSIYLLGLLAEEKTVEIREMIWREIVRLMDEYKKVISPVLWEKVRDLVEGAE